MLFSYRNKIIKKPINSCNEERTFNPTKRLGGGNYPTSFNVLINCDLIKTFAVNRYKLTIDYIHLLKQEKFDEN